MGFIGSAGVSSWPRHHDRLPGRDGGAVASVPARAGHTLVPAFAIFLLNIADVFTTHRILGLGGRELNPVAGWLEVAPGTGGRGGGSRGQYARQGQQAEQDAHEQDDAKRTVVHSRLLS